MSEIESKVLEITARILKKKPEEVTLEMRYREDLGADSLDVVELMYEFEQAFNVPIPDEKVARVKTVGDVARLLAEVAKK